MQGVIQHMIYIPSSTEARDGSCPLYLVHMYVTLVPTSPPSRPHVSLNVPPEDTGSLRIMTLGGTVQDSIVV